MRGGVEVEDVEVRQREMNLGRRSAIPGTEGGGGEGGVCGDE